MVTSISLCTEDEDDGNSFMNLTSDNESIARRRPQRVCRFQQRQAAQICAVLLLVLISVFVLGSSQKDHGSCQSRKLDSQALFDYMEFYDCEDSLPLAVKCLLLLVWFGLLISLMATTADNFFIPQLEKLSAKLKLSEDMAGVTLLALGNGMPDVMTATSAINRADDFQLTIGEILGSANFIVSLVLAAVLLCNKEPTQVDPYPFMRDSLGFSAIFLLVVAATWDRQIGMLEGCFFFIVYFAYVGVVVLPQKMSCCRQLISRTSSRTTDSFGLELHELADECNSEVTAQAEEVFLGLDTGGVEGFMGWLQYTMEFPFSLLRHASIASAVWDRRRRLLVACCPFTSVIMLVVSFCGWNGLKTQWGPLPAMPCLMIPCSIVGCLVLATTSSNTEPRWHVFVLIHAMLTVICWFNLLANECVALLETLGITFGIPSSVLGLTVLSWGNSVGDLVADVALAKRGKSRTAIAGVFASPLLSDVLGLGVSLTSYAASKGSLHAVLSVQNKLAAAFLTLSLVSSMIVFSLYKFSCPRRFAYILLAQYGLLVLVSVIAEQTGYK